MLSRSTLVFAITTACLAVHNSVPAVLNPEVIAEVAGVEESEAATFALYRNPITGAWPKLNAISPSPGDMFCRPLTRQEAQHFSGPGGDTSLGLLLKGKAINDFGKQVDARMLGDAWYVRVYGVNGRVIISDIDKWYMFK
jgi:hypothetical protein